MISAMNTNTWHNKIQYVFHSVMHMKEPLHSHTRNCDYIANTMEDETNACLNYLHNNLYMHIQSVPGGM